jgi:pyruvate,orthophosphate dikinase
MKCIYKFGNGQAEGNGSMKDLLGGKGANLAEMDRIGLPVPPGFTITTEVCKEFQKIGKGKTKALLYDESIEALHFVQDIMDQSFGDSDNPLLFSVRSGAKFSMPGMMNTVLDVGLTDESVVGLAKKTGKEKFAWDAYRRLIQMYGNVVMKITDEHDEDPFEHEIEAFRKAKGVKYDKDFSAEDLKELVGLYKQIVLKYSGREFPQDPKEQIWDAIMAVFESWNVPRAIHYRQLNNISNTLGTAVNVQAMVYGNMGEHSASGVAFTRNAATGENLFNGEYLIDAQGEDVVAGIRTPQQITLEGSRQWAKFANISEEERKTKYPSLEEYMPEVFDELLGLEHILEDHFRDMQDLEFTVQEDRLWLLQTRNGKRTGSAMVKIAMDMLREGRIDEETALMRIEPEKINELLHPVFDPKELKKAKEVAIGLPASPGAATGRIVFRAEDVEKYKSNGDKVILCRVETSPDDLMGMNISEGILTARGGMTSHAAVVARGMGKCCVSGAGSLEINYRNNTMKSAEVDFKEGDWISIDGSTGKVYQGVITTVEPELSGDFGELMNLCDKFTRLKVRTNADTPDAAGVARKFGAMGIGLTRTEHMFFEEDRIQAMRGMIMAKDVKGREKALAKLLPMQRGDFEGIFEAMDGFPVTIRLLDPPLHEFLPVEDKDIKIMATELGLTYEEVVQKSAQLKETNPMLGHRGCRLGTTYPEISRMQARAILEAAIKTEAKGIKVFPEIMIPLTGTLKEMAMQKEIIVEEAEDVFEEQGRRINYLVGTMIEVPRAALISDQIATEAEFFSYGTNDLTQMTFGFSRDDAGTFLPEYVEKGILPRDPFQALDQEGVGQLIKMSIEKGKKTRPDLHVGICGEHGGEPSSVEFCHFAGLDYVSCSPFRVPIARIAAAQAAVKETVSEDIRSVTA